MPRLFGTDGVRGVANADLTPELAYDVGRAGATVVAGDRPADAPILVGRDTRMSGPMLEAAIVAGITSTGRNVMTLGVVPTPAVAALTRHFEAAAGVMISASHNPVEDNGIKFFGADGFKLADATEDEIERRLRAADLPRPTHDGVGMVQPARGVLDRYVADLLDAAEGTRLDGLTVVVDAAYGAAYAVGPRVLERLGATVIPLHAEDDGSRINVACGATHLEPLRARVREERERGTERVVGVAFDGDADRALFVDETGAPVTGDHTLLILGRDLHARGALPGDTIVGTVMANVGLERALREAGIRLERAPVGDRYVLERLRAGGYRLGGEQSGHVIDIARGTTGDGPLTAVALFATMVRARTSLHELARSLVIYPQVLVNVRVADRAIADAPAVRDAVEAGQRRLGESGRILVRPSGTEPLVRVMVEAHDDATTHGVAEEVAAVIRGL